MASKEAPKISNDNPIVLNGTAPDTASTLNGSLNGLSTKESSPSSGKENQTKEDGQQGRKDMLPKIYDILGLEDKNLIENVPTKQLQ